MDGLTAVMKWLLKESKSDMISSPACLGAYKGTQNWAMQRQKGYDYRQNKLIMVIAGEE